MVHCLCLCFLLRLHQMLASAAEVSNQSDIQFDSHVKSILDIQLSNAKWFHLFNPVQGSGENPWNQMHGIKSSSKVKPSGEIIAGWMFSSPRENENSDCPISTDGAWIGNWWCLNCQAEWCELTPGYPRASTRKSDVGKSGKRGRKVCKAMITDLSFMTESLTPLVVLDRLVINTQEVHDEFRQDSTDSIKPEWNDRNWLLVLSPIYAHESISSGIIRNLWAFHLWPIGEFDSVISRTDDTRKVRAIRKAKLGTDPIGSMQGSWSLSLFQDAEKVDVFSHEGFANRDFHINKWREAKWVRLARQCLWILDFPIPSPKPYPKTFPFVANGRSRKSAALRERRMLSRDSTSTIGFAWKAW